MRRNLADSIRRFPGNIVYPKRPVYSMILNSWRETLRAGFGIGMKIATQRANTRNSSLPLRSRCPNVR